jgi:hypothetical protein
MRGIGFWCCKERLVQNPSFKSLQWKHIFYDIQSLKNLLHNGQPPGDLKWLSNESSNRIYLYTRRVLDQGDVLWMLQV